MFRQVAGYDLPTPFADAMLPDGSRLHVVIPQITRRHMAVNIRKFVLGLHSPGELVAAGSVTQQAARFLEACVVAGLNVLVSGGTQAGKARTRPVADCTGQGLVIADDTADKRVTAAPTADRATPTGRGGCDSAATKCCSTASQHAA